MCRAQGSSACAHPRHPALAITTPSPRAGKAAWIAGTTFLVLFVPFIIEMDREAQLMEIENQQLGALTGPAPAAK